ncbi:MAG: hypothetical protein WAV41_05920 [Microgenomates group bacterium]
MDNKSFWLANIGLDTLSISLVTYDQNFQVSSLGPVTPYKLDPVDFSAAVDLSLSTAAENISLLPELEPDTIALIIPPYWVGNDGKIMAEKLKLFEELFKSLKLRPMGFICYDDAIAEANNQIEGYPASFVLVNFSTSIMTVSLVYLGKVIERIQKNADQNFNSNLLESTLIEFESESTLPPQIIVTGDYSEMTLESIKSYPWINRKDVETFLHFPDIKSYSPKELASIYLKAVTNQFENLPPAPLSKPPQPEVAVEELIIENPSSPLVGVDPEDVGFGPVDTNFATPSVEIETVTNEFTPPAPTLPKTKFSFPKLSFRFPSFPKISHNIFFIPLTLSPLLILIPFFFSTAQITLYLTPYVFTKTIPATFDSTISSVDLPNNRFPITSQSKELTTSVSVAATGQKTTGDRAGGEVTIFNKSDKAISLTRGTILSDSATHKFELESAVQIAASSSDLTMGVITLGQTKAMIKALDIGPEYNLEKDVRLQIKDYSDAIIIVKVNSSLAGGTRRQITAVSATDKNNLDNKLKESINSTISQYTQQISTDTKIIPELTKTTRGRVEYNREVGEEADELSTTVITTITTYFFTDTQKSIISEALFSTDPDYSSTSSNFNQFSVGFLPNKQTIFTVQYLPKVAVATIAKLATGKSQARAISLIKKSLPRVYNYQISTNFSAITLINPLPLRSENISVTIK